MSAGVAFAQEYTINVWTIEGGNDNYRHEAIEIAADLLEREHVVLGKDLTINIVAKQFSDWAPYKQAITLAAEAGTAPHIVTAGHEDIAAWSQSGLIVPIEDYIDLDSWPVNDIYPNLLQISSFNGQLWGLPQDAESRPFFMWRDHMKAIGYSDAQILSLIHISEPTRPY